MKSKMIKTKSAKQLASVLGLSPFEGVELEIKSNLTDKIIETVKKRNITHQQLAIITGSSRTRITAILNRNLYQVSTDLLLKILGALGITIKISFQTPKLVA